METAPQISNWKIEHDGTATHWFHDEAGLDHFTDEQFTAVVAANMIGRQGKEWMPADVFRNSSTGVIVTAYPDDF